MTSPAIRRVATTNPKVYAFEIDGEVSGEEMAEMADTMNAAFDAQEKVDMLLIFRDYEGSEMGAGLDWSSIKSRFRSLANVDKYVAVGAPDSAAAMIEVMGKIIPVEARTYPMSQLDVAWTYLGARPA